MNRNLPLGLPEGSVRAIFTLTLLFTCCWGVVTGHNVPEWFSVLTGGAVGSYFPSRSPSGNGDANTTVRGDATVNVGVDGGEKPAVEEK